MKIVYIAHPVSGNVHANIVSILGIVKSINLSTDDVVPLVPYLADIMALDDSVPEQRRRGIENGRTIMSSGLIEELWVFGGYENSQGCNEEIKLAIALRIKIVYHGKDGKARTE